MDTPPECVSNGRHTSCLGSLTPTYKKASHGDEHAYTVCSSCSALLSNVTQTGLTYVCAFLKTFLAELLVLVYL